MKSFLVSAVFFFLGFFFGWKAVVGVITLFLLYVVLRLVYRYIRLKKLPRAIVEVENNKVEFPHLIIQTGIATSFTNVLETAFCSGSLWQTDLKAHNMRILPPFPLGQIVGTCPAKLILSERTFDLQMVKTRDRCTCDVPVPHWTGDRYFCFFTLWENGEYWVVQLDLTKHDRRSKRRVRDRAKARKQSLALFPQPFPAGSSFRN